MGFDLFQQLVGWSGIVLLGVLCARAVQIRSIFRFPAFFGYVGYVLLSSVSALIVVRSAPKFYPDFYWLSELVALLLGLTVTLEIYQNAFSGYPGVRKVANGLIFSLAMIALFRLLGGGIPPQHATVLVLERDLRTVQALMLIVFAALVLYYAIPINRNLMGIALGYGCFVSTSVFNLTLRAQLGAEFQRAWAYLQPLEYCFCVIIWCVTLWSLAPSPGAEAGASGETYQAISQDTELRFGRLRAHIIKRST